MDEKENHPELLYECYVYIITRTDCCNNGVTTYVESTSRDKSKAIKYFNTLKTRYTDGVSSFQLHRSVL